MNLTAILDRFLKLALALLMAAMVTSVVWQVLSRYLFVVPAAWTEELARFLLIWIGMLGAAYAYREGSHLGIDLLANKLETAGKQKLHSVVHIVCLLFAVSVLVVGGGSLVSMTWELKQYSAAIGLPIALVYAVIPLSGALISLFAAEAIVNGPSRQER
ncbi:MAG: TRAP transporter small permease [Woeseiaceae bacterium]|nr:TRAP transporter small permease [Woeseiaceae bacterium]